MLSMYRGDVLLTLDATIGLFFGLKTESTVEIIPWNYAAYDVIAESEEEARLKFKTIGYDCAYKYLTEMHHAKKENNYITFSGVNREYRLIDTPCIYDISKAHYEVIGFTKLYDFKDKSVSFCMEKLTPDRFKKEFGFLIQTT